MSAVTGALLLDKARREVPFLAEAWSPSWAHLVDLPRLDMGDPRWCLLGQLCPPGILAQRSLWDSGHMRYLALGEWLSGLPDHKRRAWSQQHGFLVPGTPLTLAESKQEWEHQIKMRLVAA